MNPNANILFWLALFKYFSGSTKVMAMGFLGGTATMGLKPWATVTIASYVTMMTYTEGFIDQTAAKLAAGKPPVGTNGTGNTEHIPKPANGPSPAAILIFFLVSAAVGAIVIGTRSQIH